MDEKQLLEAIRTVVREEIAPVKEQVAGVSDRLDTVQGQVEGMSTRLDTLQEQQENTNTRLDTLQEQQENTNTRLDALQEQQEIHTSSILNLENSVMHELKLLNENLPDAIVRHEKLTEVSEKVDNHDHRIFALEQAVNNR